MTVRAYKLEIMHITDCSAVDSHILYESLLAHFGNLGSVKFSRFASQAKKMYLILLLKYSLN